MFPHQQLLLSDVVSVFEVSGNPGPWSASHSWLQQQTGRNSSILTATSSDVIILWRVVVLPLYVTQTTSFCLTAQMRMWWVPPTKPKNMKQGILLLFMRKNIIVRPFQGEWFHQGLSGSKCHLLWQIKRAGNQCIFAVSTSRTEVGLCMYVYIHTVDGKIKKMYIMDIKNIYAYKHNWVVERAFQTYQRIMFA